VSRDIDETTKNSKKRRRDWPARGCGAGAAAAAGQAGRLASCEKLANVQQLVCSAFYFHINVFTKGRHCGYNGGFCHCAIICHPQF